MGNPALPVDSPRALALKLAAQIALQVGMVRTWPNIQTIRMAIESEASLSSVSLGEAAEVITQAAHEWTRGPEYSCPAEWVKRELCRFNTIDRFWFEDARWRAKGVYLEWRSGLAEASA